METGRFRRSDRLLDSRDFRRVLKRGRRRADSALVVVTAPREPLASPGRSDRDGPSGVKAVPGPRLGITVGRRAGNAVVRNRFKRRLRAWFRENRGALADDADVVVIARPAGARLDYDALGARLTHLLELSRPRGGDGSEKTRARKTG